MSDFIIGIKINENKEDDYFTYQIDRLVWDEEFNNWAQRSV